MTATLPKKVAFRAEHTGAAPQDRAQRMAQQVGAAHEQTKTYVTSLATRLAVLENRAYTALAANTTIGAAAYATLLTANITTTLATGYLVITFTASGVHITNQGTTYFQVLVDGTVVKGAYTTVGVGFAWTASIMVRVAVTAQAHVVLLQWKTDIASARINAVANVEEHAALLVQEAA